MFNSKSIYIQKILFITIILFSTGCMAAEFYVDPVNGNMSNDGSQARPWSTMAEVWSTNKIKTQYWNTPYSSTNPTLSIKNPSAPVQPGDTIYLLSGYHGDLQIYSAVNSAPITIKAAPGATAKFKRIFLRSASNWIFEGLSVSPSNAPEFVKVAAMVTIENHSYTGPSSDITIKDCELFAVDSIEGWTINDWLTYAGSGISGQGNNIVIDNVLIRNTLGGIGLRESAYSQIRNTTIHDIGQDGIQLAGCDYVKVEYNTIKNIYSVVEGNHYDMIQAWTLETPITGVEIRGNTLIMSDDVNQPYLVSVQGIGMFDGWYDDFVIENNLIVTNSYHGIAFYGARNCKIVNNTVTSVLNISPVGTAPINVFPHKINVSGYGNIIQNNIVQGINTVNNGLAGGILVNSNNVTSFRNADHFTNASGFDFTLKSTSSAINAGAVLYAPLNDIAKKRRDNEPDIGAYEYGVGTNLTPPKEFNLIESK